MLYVPVVSVPTQVVTDLAALQLAGVPPPLPAQVHVHGPVPPTADGVPALQRFVVGATDTVVPLAVPHTPLIGVGAALLVTPKLEVAMPPLPVTVTVHVWVPVQVSPALTNVGVTVSALAV